MNIEKKITIKYPYKRVNCQYCGNLSTIATGLLLYGKGHKLANREFYHCKNCEAWVGMHEVNKKPFGALAKSDLRKKRVLAHSLFDDIWKDEIKKGLSKSKARKQAYNWLAENLNIPIEQCHIGAFSIEECNKVMVLCFKRRAQS